MLNLHLHDHNGGRLESFFLTIIGFGMKDFTKEFNEEIKKLPKIELNNSTYYEVDFDRLMPMLIGKLSQKSMGKINHLRYTYEGRIYARDFSGYHYSY